MVSIPKRVADRFVKEVGKFQNVLRGAKDRDINEADTITIVTDILARVFGFDKYTEITSEQAIRGTYCDLAIKTKGNIKFLIEVKAIGLELKESHLRQALNYGANQGIQWILLTNGVNWETYRLRFEKPLAYDPLCSFNFLELNPRKRDDQDRLFILCKEGLDKAAIDEFHEYISSVNKFMIAAVIQGDPVLDAIRRELRRISPGVKVEKDEINDILVNEVLKRDVLEGEPANRASSRVRKASGRALKKHKSMKTADEDHHEN